MLEPERGNPGGTGARETANARFKRRTTGLIWPALASAALAHYAVFSLLPGLPVSVRHGVPATSAMELLTLLPIVSAPPPTRPARPPAPIEASRPLPRPPAAVVPVEPTIELPADDPLFEPITFDDLPPPAITATPAVAASAPPGGRYAPVDVQPQLRNRAAVVNALKRNYPPRLQAAGIGGTVLLWFWIDEQGQVERYELKDSSGYPELDKAAERVIEVMEFSPALRQGAAAAVVVELPIVFESR